MEFNLADLTSVIQIGCSPRATLGLVSASRALALIHGRDYVLPTDVQAVAKDVMAHRIVLGFDAVADNITTAQVIDRIVAMVPPPTPVMSPKNTSVTNVWPRLAAASAPDAANTASPAKSNQGAATGRISTGKGTGNIAAA